MVAHFRGQRPITEAVLSLDEKYGIKYESFSDDWVFKLARADQAYFINGYALPHNSQAAAKNADDKVITYQLLASENIAAVPHNLLSHILQPVIDQAYLEKLFTVHGPVVLKPTRGGGGHLVFKCDSPGQVLKLASESAEPNWCVAPFIKVHSEMRLIVYGQEIMLAFLKVNPVIKNGLAMFNLNYGTAVQTIKLNRLPASIRDMAVSSMRAIGLRVGAVDVIFDEHAHASVLEINSGFSLDHFSATSPDNHRLAVEIYQKLILGLFEK